MRPKPPHLSIKFDSWHKLPQEHFQHAVGGQKAEERTLVAFKVNQDFFQVRFECLDNPFTAQNQYTEHNSELWQQEVFELFISVGHETSNKYLEFEINPNGALWLGKILNDNGPKADMIDPVLAGVISKVSKESNKWHGEFSIPMKLLGQTTNEFRFNFYRIVSKISQTENPWSGNDQTCTYQCFSPTMSEPNAAFHIPEEFAFLKVEGS